MLLLSKHMSNSSLRNWDSIAFARNLMACLNTKNMLPWKELMIPMKGLPSCAFYSFHRLIDDLVMKQSPTSWGSKTKLNLSRKQCFLTLAIPQIMNVVFLPWCPLSRKAGVYTDSSHPCFGPCSEVRRVVIALMSLSFKGTFFQERMTKMCWSHYENDIFHSTTTFESSIMNAPIWNT